MKSWTLSDDVLEIADGTVRIPVSVDQIILSILKNSPIYQDLPVGKCGDAIALQFSRFPVDMMVVMTADKAGLPVLKFEAKTQWSNTFSVSRRAITQGHVVHDNTWFPAFSENANTLNELLNEIDFSLELSRPKRFSGFLLLKSIAVEGGPVVDKLPSDALRKLASEFDTKEKPKGISAKLYPYQKDGWNWLRFIMREHLGGVLADEMGLGKTLQIICALSDPSAEHRNGVALIISPGSLLENWMREFTKFCPTLRVLKHHGRFRTGSPADLLEYDIVLSSYETVVRDLSLMKMVSWNAVVIDEAQNIRNPDALRSTSIKQLNREVGFAVTGTPIENRLRDLWSIMDFVVPGYLGDLKSFERSYVDDVTAATALEPLVSPLMLRRLVSEVASDLPERIDIPEILEMEEIEAHAYDQLRKEIAEQYGAIASLISLGKLRQFCSHPNLLESASDANFRKFSKFARLQELLEEILSFGEKVLIFTSYTKMSDMIMSMATSKFGVMAATLDGRLDISKRQPLIDQFEENSGSALLVLNPKAGGSGLNITAANHVIHYNPEWNPALEDQASARAYRRGQKRPVTIRRLIYSRTVEEVINERLNRKREISDRAIIGVEGKEQDYADILAALECSPTSDFKDN